MQLFFRAFVPLWGFHLFYAASAASFTACAIIVKVVDLLCKQNDRLLSFELKDIVNNLFFCFLSICSSQHESVRKPLVINVLALVSLAIGTFSAVFWVSAMLSTEAAFSHLISLCWLPFSTLAGTVAVGTNHSWTIVEQNQTNGLKPVSSYWSLWSLNNQTSLNNQREKEKSSD